jgi:ATP-binding cassette subfamily B (MDR/TAP) protein 1
LNYLQSFISQEVAFFENPKHSPGVLTAKLLQHPLEIEDFFCRNIPVVLIIVVTILSCSILAIATGWKLGLVTVFGALAPICIAGLIRIQLGYINEKRTHEIYYESAGFVSEYVAAPRTVNSLCMENTLVSEYRDLLQGPLRQAKKNALYTMFFLALTDSLQICGMALAFW